MNVYLQGPDLVADDPVSSTILSYLASVNANLSDYVTSAADAGTLPGMRWSQINFKIQVNTSIPQFLADPGISGILVTTFGEWRQLSGETPFYADMLGDVLVTDLNVVPVNPAPIDPNQLRNVFKGVFDDPLTKVNVTASNRNLALAPEDFSFSDVMTKSIPAYLGAFPLEELSRMDSLKPSLYPLFFPWHLMLPANSAECAGPARLDALMSIFISSLTFEPLTSTLIMNNLGAASLAALITSGIIVPKDASDTIRCENRSIEPLTYSIGVLTPMTPLGEVNGFLFSASMKLLSGRRVILQGLSLEPDKSESQGIIVLLGYEGVGLYGLVDFLFDLSYQARLAEFIDDGVFVNVLEYLEPVPVAARAIGIVCQPLDAIVATAGDYEVEVEHGPFNPATANRLSPPAIRLPLALLASIYAGEVLNTQNDAFRREQDNATLEVIDSLVPQSIPEGFRFLLPDYQGGSDMSFYLSEAFLEYAEPSTLDALGLTQPSRSFGPRSSANVSLLRMPSDHSEAMQFALASLILGMANTSNFDNAKLYFFIAPLPMGLILQQDFGFAALDGGVLPTMEAVELALEHRAAGKDLELGDYPLFSELTLFVRPNLSVPLIPVPAGDDFTGKDFLSDDSSLAAVLDVAEAILRMKPADLARYGYAHLPAARIRSARRALADVVGEDGETSLLEVAPCTSPSGALCSAHGTCLQFNSGDFGCSCFSGFEGSLCESVSGDDDSSENLGIILGSSLGGAVVMCLCCCLALCCVVCAACFCVTLVLVVLVVVVVVACVVLVVVVAAAGASISALVAGGSAGISALKVRARRREKDLKEQLDVDLADALHIYAEEHGELLYRELEYGDLVFEEKVGEGAFGAVYRGHWRGAEVAIKTTHAHSLSENVLEDLRSEAIVMTHLGNHPNLVTFIGAVTCNTEQFCLVTEFCCGGSLLACMLRFPEEFAEPRAQLRAARDAARGLVYLHREKAVHRDIAARNCLVDAQGAVKVSDFGTSRLLEDQEGEDGRHVDGSNIGPVRWMAPESLRDQEYSAKSDVYMFGVLVWEIIAGGRLPYEDRNLEEIANGVIQGSLRPSVPKGAYPELAAVMKECWKADPGGRPAMKKVLRRIEIAFDGVSGVNTISSSFASSSAVDAPTEYRLPVPSTVNYVVPSKIPDESY